MCIDRMVPTWLDKLVACEIRLILGPMLAMATKADSKVWRRARRYYGEGFIDPEPIKDLWNTWLRN